MPVYEAMTSVWFSCKIAPLRTISSVVERCIHIADVGGSNPSSSTNGRVFMLDIPLSLLFYQESSTLRVIVNPLILFIGVFLFVSGIVLGRQSQSPSSKIFGFTSSLQKETPTIAPSPTYMVPSLTPEPTASNTPIPSEIKITPTSKPTAAPLSSSTKLTDFRYPNSSVNSDTNEKLVLTSSDSSQAITTWYENRLKELGYSSSASAKTNTNGNVMNKLAGSKNESSVSIEIVKKASESKTTITITKGSDSSSEVHIKIQNNSSSM